MNKLVLISFLLCILCLGGTYKKITRVLPKPKYMLVEKDSIGLIVDYQEKYGMAKTDTCTIIMESHQDYILIRRDQSKNVLIKGNINSIKWKKIKN